MMTMMKIGVVCCLVLSVWASHSASAGYVYLNITQTIQQYNYSAEEHHVTTADGWVLALQRILPKSGSKKGAVLLQHGLVDSGYTWVANLPHQSLGFLLADQGYDVWLGNSRGNTWSGVNLQYADPNSTLYWNFTWDQMLAIDLPTMIDYILATSQVPDLAYVGHSQGGIIGLGGLAAQPSYQKKVRIVIGLAPALFLKNCSAPGVQAAAKLPTNLIYQAIGHLGIAQSTPALQQSLYTTCSVDPLLCADTICEFAGCVSPQNYNASSLPSLVLHFPAGTATKDIGHFQQQVQQQIFRMYDYGERLNPQYYGQPQPPVYPLQNLALNPQQLPLAVFYGGRDLLVDPTDVEYLLTQLPPSTYSQLLPDFGHGDFVWGLSSAQVLYPQVIQLINQRYQ